MTISTQHLLPPSDDVLAPPSLGLTTPAIASTNVSPELPTFTVAPQPPQDDTGPTSSTSVLLSAKDAKSKSAEPAESVDPSVVDEGENSSEQAMEVEPLHSEKQESAPAEAVAPPMDVDRPPGSPPRVIFDHTRSFPGGFPIDVEFEASKLPLDVAVFNSARASGMAHALESRFVDHRSGSV